VSDPAVPLVRTPHWEIGDYSPEQVQRMKETYDGAIAYTDRALGRFFGRLKELGVYDKATIMLTADHGEAFGEHGVFLHAHHLYDEIVRAPLIVKAPHMSKRGAYSPTLAQSIDLFPTIARAFGLPLAKDLLGADLFALMANSEKTRSVIAEFTNFGIKRRMLRTLADKVVWQLPADEAQFLASVKKKSLLPSVTFDRETVKLFDMAKDPLEHRDLYSEQAMREPRWAKLMQSLRAYEKRHAAQSATVVERLDAETYRDLKELGYID
jgi:arylsulfatase A-like enzyme